MNVRELVTILKFKTDNATIKSAENSVTRVKEMMERIKPATLKVNTGGFSNQLNALQTKIDSLTNTKTVKVNLNTSGASRQVDNLKTKLNSLTKTKTANVKVNTGTASRQVNTLQNRINRLAQPKQLQIGVNTAELDKATQSLNRFSQAQTRASQSHFRGKAKGLAEGQSAGGMGSSLVGGLKAGLVALGGMAIVNEIKETADAMMSLSSRIKIVTKDEAERLKIESALYNMSMKNRASLQDIGDLYYKTSMAAQRFGASQEDVLRLTDIVSKSLIIGGADVNQQKATILQLSQALGSGVLQGDELRSLRENAPVLMQQISAFLGKDMGELKQMGAKGELTTELLMKAILSSGQAVDEQFGKITPTIGQALTVLGNKWQKLILDVQNSTGVFGTIAGLILDGVDLVGQAIDWVVQEFGTATPEMTAMLQDFKDLWTSLQPLVQALGTIFMNWVVPALKMFGRVASSVLGMVAQLLQPIADLLGKIAGLIADASNGFSGLISKAESGAIDRYNNIMTEYNQTQNNNIVVSSPADAGRVMRDGTFFSRHR